MARILIEGFMCERCQYRWAPRPLVTPHDGPRPEPQACPNCKSRYWNKPRRLARDPKYRAKLWQIADIGGLPGLNEE